MKKNKIHWAIRFILLFCKVVYEESSGFNYKMVTIFKEFEGVRYILLRIVKFNREDFNMIASHQTGDVYLKSTIIHL